MFYPIYSMNNCNIAGGKRSHQQTVAMLALPMGNVPNLSISNIISILIILLKIRIGNDIFDAVFFKHLMATMMMF